jgi:hypothetical protein
VNVEVLMADDLVLPSTFLQRRTRNKEQAKPLKNEAEKALRRVGFDSTLTEGCLGVRPFALDRRGARMRLGKLKVNV